MNYEIIIKPQLPKDYRLYPTTEQTKMIIMYNDRTNKVQYIVKMPRNPIYAIESKTYDCGEYSLIDILRVCETYDEVKFNERN